MIPQLHQALDYMSQSLRNLLRAGNEVIEMDIIIYKTINVSIPS